MRVPPNPDRVGNWRGDAETLPPSKRAGQDRRTPLANLPVRFLIGVDSKLRAPDRLGGFHQQPQLALLILQQNAVADHRKSEAALRAQAQSLRGVAASRRERAGRAPAEFPGAASLQ